MTGVNHKRIRHYAPGVLAKQNRLNPDMSAMLFRAGVKVASTTERLIADVSIKAAMPSIGGGKEDTDNKKRGLESGSKFVNDKGVVYDPSGKKGPNKYLKLHVTDTERKQALMSADPVPNFGWVEKGETNTPHMPKGVKVSVQRYRVDPRTNKPILSTGYDPFNPFTKYMPKGEIKEKALGRTIDEEKPGSRLLHFGARAAGVIVDALGKFRCPPGTPAANRFTNERGEGCLAIGHTAAVLMAATVANIASDGGGAHWIENLLRVGVAAAEIKEIWRKEGMDGVQRFASTYLTTPLGGRGHLKGEKYADPSYRGGIAAQIASIMSVGENRTERMARVAEEKRLKIADLMTAHGLVPSGDEEADIIKLLEKIGENPAHGLAASGHEFYVGGTKDSHDKWLRSKFFEAHYGAIKHYYGDMTLAEFEAKYHAEKSAGGTPFTQAIDDMHRRESQMRTGMFEQIALDATTRRDSLKDVIIITDFDKDLPGRSDFYELNGMAGGGTLYVGSGPAVRGHRDGPPAGHMDLYTATGGTQEEQWAAVAAAIAADDTGRYWAHTFSTDLAAMHGRGWRDFGAQAGAHEVYHYDQINAIKEWHKAKQALDPSFEAGVDFDSLNNAGLLRLAERFLDDASPEMLREALGADIEDLIDKRLDAVAGAYSGVEQQNALKKIRAANAGAIPMVEANNARSLALFETMAELGANRNTGLIGDDPALDALVDHVFGPPGPSTAIPAVPAGPTVPAGTTPAVPGSAPRPSRPYVPGSGPKWIPESAPTVAPRPGGTRPSGGSRGRGFDPFSGRRKGKIPKALREDNLTFQDVDEMVNGKPTGRKTGLLAILDYYNRVYHPSPSADSMEQEAGRRAHKDMRDIIKSLAENGGLSPEEIDTISQKILNQETLSSEEEQKLENSIIILRQHIATMTRALKDIEDLPHSERTRETSIQRMRLERLQRSLGQSLTAPLNDLWDINEHYKSGGKLHPTGRTYSPIPDDLFPDVPGYEPRREPGYEPIRDGGFESASRVAKKQTESLSAEELSIVSSATRTPPNPSWTTLPPGIAKEFLEVNETYERYGLRNDDYPIDDIETFVPVLKVLDNSNIDEDLIVETEIPIDSNDIGSTISLDGLSSTDIIDRPRASNGFASRSETARKHAGTVGRILNSSAARKAFEKMGLDPENEDLVSLAAETAIAFSAGGPAAAIIPIARRGSRDAGEKALQMMVKKGWITNSVASKISAYGLDRIAKEGLPDEIMEAMKTVGVAVTDEETKKSALRMAGALQDRSSELMESSRRTIRKMRERIESIGDGKSAYVEIEVKALGEGIGKNNVPQKEAKKQKVRITVPSGSKGRVDEDGKVLLPPGKMKVTGIDEDGVTEAEVTEQTSAIDYMKNAEKKLAENAEKTTNEKLKQLLHNSSKKYAQMAKDEQVSSRDYASSGVSKITLNKAQAIIDDAKDAGYSLFNDEYVFVNGKKQPIEDFYGIFMKSMTDVIEKVKINLDSNLFPEDKELHNFIKINSAKTIYSELMGIADAVFAGIDRRARVTMTRSSLQDFLTSGRIANIDVDSKMLSEMKKHRDRIVGGSDSSDEFALTPVDLIHEYQTHKIERSLYTGGTKVGSEEFADYGRGIDVVLRSENSKRIGFG